MTATRYLTIFIIVLVNVNFGEVLGDEKSEEAQPNYEYIQIFKSIPALFEYLLNALEERPEILEKNDVTMFSRNIDIFERNEFENYDNEKKMDKRDTDSENPEEQDEYVRTNDVEQRDANNAKSDLKTTVAYEYGNSKIVMKDSDDPDSKEKKSKRAANSDCSTNDEQSFEGEILKSVFKLDDESLNELLQYYGDAFLGFEHFFGLDLNPEKVEERILEAEKLLEEHNNKKDTGDKE